GAIMNKIQTTGKLQGDELMQLSDRGLPILSKIAEMKGVDDNTARDMISKGQISSQDAFKAATMAAGNSAAEMGKTREGAKMNFGAALSKLGAGLLGGSDGEEGGIFGAMTPALLKVNEVLNGLIPTFQKVGDTVGGFVTGGFKKAKAGFEKASQIMTPFINKFKTGLTGTIDKLSEVFTPLKEKFASAFDTLKEAFAPVIEAFSSLFSDNIGDGFSLLGTAIDIVAGAFGVLADIIVALNPVWELLASFITGIVLPAFESVSSFVVDTVVPAFSNIADMVGGWVTEAFQLIGDAVNIAKAAFDAVKGAVDTAVDAFFSIPGKIASALSGIGGAVWEAVTSWIPGKKKNATGTDYFSGGLTQINEQGQEMMKLPMGTKIYPAGATRRALEKETRATRPVTNNQDTSNSIVINVNGANMTNKDVGRVISNELRRLGVVV
uniref:tape measure protein n=1 Tax=uncultured Anaerococcus sp. TaxID=293428 RepID=UPI002613F7CA